MPTFSLRRARFALGAITLSLLVYTTLSFGAYPLRQVYWVSREPYRIQCSDPDGSNVTDVLIPPGAPKEIAIDKIHAKIYWVDGEVSWTDVQGIKRSNLDGSDIEVILVTSSPLSGSLLYDVELDVGAGKMYWTDRVAGKIQRANLNGTFVEDIVTGHPAVYIALDLGGGKMYWSEGQDLFRANLDGSGIEQLISAVRISAFVLDLAGGQIYWANSVSSSEYGIYHANLDGSAIGLAFKTGTNNVGEIALDTVGSKLYWRETYANRIRRANLNGSEMETVATGTSRGGMVLDGQAGRIHFATGGIERMNLDGTGRQWVVLPLGAPLALAMDYREGRMYWSDSAHRIWRANLEGRFAEQLQTTTFYTYALELDVSGRKLYWLSGPSMYCSNLDGSDTRIVSTRNENQTSAMTIDDEFRKIYWTDAYGDYLYRSNFDASGFEALFDTPDLGFIDYLQGIAFDERTGKIYWAHMGDYYSSLDSRVRRANLDGSDVEDVLNLGNVDVRDIALDRYANRVFAASENGIWRANLDGSDPVNIVDAEMFAYGIALYAPDPSVPTMLAGFAVDVKPAAVDISWELGADYPGVSFVVDRSDAASGTFAAVGKVDGPESSLHYRFVDETCEPGESYRYRVVALEGNEQQVLFETETVRVPGVTLALHENYPNPFNPSTRISFTLPQRMSATLRVYTVDGKLVRELASGAFPAGTTIREWDGRDIKGNEAASGVYFCVLNAGGRILTQRMVLVR